jgi:hypothetical protein
MDHLDVVDHVEKILGQQLSINKLLFIAPLDYNYTLLLNPNVGFHEFL